MLDFKFVKGVDALIFTCYDYQVVTFGDNEKLSKIIIDISFGRCDNNLVGKLILLNQIKNNF